MNNCKLQHPSIPCPLPQPHLPKAQRHRVEFKPSQMSVGGSFRSQGRGDMWGWTACCLPLTVIVSYPSACLQVCVSVQTLKRAESQSSASFILPLWTGCGKSHPSVRLCFLCTRIRRQHFAGAWPGFYPGQMSFCLCSGNRGRRVVWVTV